MKKLSKKQKLIIFVAIITILVIIGIIIGANIIKTNIASGRYNSANSNSSSANLLPEYIKEGITLGGVTGSLVDLDTSDATATSMDITYGKTAYVDGEKITGLFVPRDSLEIGDYVDYTPDAASAYSLLSSVSGYSSNQTIPQETDLKWQIMSINDDGTIDLVSDKPLSTSIYWRGAIAYNNAVFAMNDICKKLYSNSELNSIARSINFDDIEAKLTDAGINARNNYQGAIASYGESYTYTDASLTYYPVLYRYENGSGINTTTVKKDGIEESDSYYTSPTQDSSAQANNELTVTRNYYRLSYSVADGNIDIYFKSKAFYDVVFGENRDFSYWVATRYVTLYEDGARFGIWSLRLGDLNGHSVYRSNNKINTYSDYLRPVITIPQNIILYGGDGSEEHPYELTK